MLVFQTNGLCATLSFGEPKLKIIGSETFDSISLSSPIEKSVEATGCAREIIFWGSWTFVGIISFNDGVSYAITSASSNESF